MHHREWDRRLRGIIALMALVLGMGGVPHAHADHDGRLAHVDEEHGPHGAVAAPDADRRPASVQSTIPAGEVLVLRVDGGLAITRWGSSPAGRTVRPAGHDPPRLNGSRAPPLS
jgi:hypothetical protein